MIVDFGGVEETVVTREEFPLERARKTLEGKTIAVLGYGSQGPGQSQNLRDNGFNVIVGQRQDSPTWNKAIEDGWVPGKTLFPLEEAAKKGDIISYLLSDASQPIIWPNIKDYVDGKTLYVSHGFPIHFSMHTGIVPSQDTDIVMVAPKGAGLSVRSNFLDGSGINASYAVHQDASGKALDTTLAIGIGIGAGYLFETTMRREVVSDHVGERAILLGEMWALAESEYDLLMSEGFGVQSAFVNSSEQLTQVILPLIGENGVEGIYEQAHTMRKAELFLDHVSAVRAGTHEIMEDLYWACANGDEAMIALEVNSRPGYRKNLERELAEIDGSEMWQKGQEVRKKFAGNRDYRHIVTNFRLAGSVIGAMESQYQTLLSHGHSPSEGFNETVEEATQSLNQFYQQKGVSNLLAVCSTTAQRGALDWGPRFKMVISPILHDLKNSDYTGSKASDTYQSETSPDMWKIGEKVRELRPENQAK